MKPEVLLELAARWERDANEPDVINGEDSLEVKLANAKACGERETKRECADALRMLVGMLG